MKTETVILNGGVLAVAVTGNEIAGFVGLQTRMASGGVWRTMSLTTAQARKVARMLLKAARTVDAVAVQWSRRGS